MAEPVSPFRPTKCPICRKPAAERNRPFCSPRCRDVDLSRWLSGGYAIAAEEEDAVDAEEKASAAREE
jgi:endogenous inhibitor of DNA gyrase (YacG/DUF329 family)